MFVPNLALAGQAKCFLHTLCLDSGACKREPLDHVLTWEGKEAYLEIPSSSPDNPLLSQKMMRFEVPESGIQYFVSAPDNENNPIIMITISSDLWPSSNPADPPKRIAAYSSHRWFIEGEGVHARPEHGFCEVLD